MRKLHRHGVLVLLISLCLGFAVAASGPGPRGRQWLGAHTTGILTGLVLIALGSLWPTLRLGERAQKVGSFLLVSGAWVGLLVLGLFTCIVGVQQAQAAPSLPPPAPWQNAVIGAAILYVSVGILGGVGTVLYGLRGAD